MPYMKIVLLPTSILGWQLSVILLTPEKKKKMSALVDGEVNMAVDW